MPEVEDSFSLYTNEGSEVVGSMVINLFKEAIDSIPWEFTKNMSLGNDNCSINIVTTRRGAVEQMQSEQIVSLPDGERPSTQFSREKLDEPYLPSGIMSDWPVEIKQINLALASNDTDRKNSGE